MDKIRGTGLGNWLVLERPARRYAEYRCQMGAERIWEIQ